MTECHKELQGLMDAQVSVITNDGRNIVGTLKGLDQKLNIVLEECQERVFSSDAGVEQVLAARSPAPCAARSTRAHVATERFLGNPAVRIVNHIALHADFSVVYAPQVPLGLYIVRGDNIAIVGEVDPQLDGGTDWANLRAEPLKHIVH